MKKIQKQELEYFYNIVVETFSLAEVTVQTIFFSVLATEMFAHNEYFSFDPMNKFKENFLKWQNVESPSMKWVNTLEDGVIKVSPFSHGNDFSWNSLDEHIFKFVSHNVIQYGCKTYQEHLKEEYQNSKSDFFENYTHPELSVYGS
jgi:hypothetical protein